MNIQPNARGAKTSEQMILWKSEDNCITTDMYMASLIMPYQVMHLGLIYSELSLDMKWATILWSTYPTAVAPA